MALIYTTDEALESLKLRASSSDTQAEGTADDDLLRYLNEAMKSDIVPFIVQRAEDYFVKTERIALVANQKRYRIPKRAIGQKLRELKLRFGVEGEERDLWRASRENINLTELNLTGTPTRFYLEGNYIVIVPMPSTTGDYLIESYFFEPGDLVLLANVRKVTTVSLATKTITMDADRPATFLTTSKFDIHSPNSGAEVKGWDLTVSSFPALNQITFNEAIDGTTEGTEAVEVGDYVCLEREAVVPAIPRQLHPMLVQAAVVQLFLAVGDLDAYEAARTEYDRMAIAAVNLLEDRVEGEGHVITGDRSVWFEGAGFGDLGF